MESFSRFIHYTANSLDMTSGANDVIVVRQPDGSLKSSPFHVRFGRAKVFRPSDKVVQIEVNGELTQAVMKIGADGTAFWLEPTTPGEVGLQESPLGSPETRSPICKGKAETLDTLAVAAATAPQLAMPDLSLSPPITETERPLATSEAPTSAVSVAERVTEVVAAAAAGLGDDSIDPAAASFPLPTRSSNSPGTRSQTSSGMVDASMIAAAQAQAVTAAAREAGVDPEEEAVPVGKDGKEQHTDPENMQLISIAGEAQPKGNHSRSKNRSRNKLLSTPPIASDMESSTPIDKDTGIEQHAAIGTPILSLGAPLPCMAAVAAVTTDGPTTDIGELLRSIETLEDKTETVPHSKKTDSPLAIKNAGCDNAIAVTEAAAGPSPLTPASPAVYDSDIDSERYSEDDEYDEYYDGEYSEDEDGCYVDGDIVPVQHNKAINAAAAATVPGSPPVTAATAATNSNVVFQRTITPISADLAKLNLKEGMNIIKYRTLTSFRGPVTEEARIYLWPHSAKIVISDVDGTITRSDILGHLLPIIGRDWTHTGICDLYTKIAKNGYQFVYLTARSVSQVEGTRRFLWGIEQGGLRLPLGPIITAPDRFFTALFQEVSKRSHEFKISALQGVRAVFPKAARPFYAGFGNRIGDVISYTATGIPKHKIFIIDHSGVVHVCQVKHTYNNLSHLAHETFPPLKPSCCVHQYPHPFPLIPTVGGNNNTDNKDNKNVSSVGENNGNTKSNDTAKAHQGNSITSIHGEEDYKTDDVDQEFNNFNFWRVDPKDLLPATGTTTKNNNNNNSGEVSAATTARSVSSAPAQQQQQQQQAATGAPGSGTATPSPTTANTPSTTTTSTATAAAAAMVAAAGSVAHSTAEGVSQTAAAVFPSKIASRFYGGSRSPTSDAKSTNSVTASLDEREGSDEEVCSNKSGSHNNTTSSNNNNINTSGGSYVPSWLSWGRRKPESNKNISSNNSNNNSNNSSHNNSLVNSNKDAPSVTSSEIHS